MEPIYGTVYAHTYPDSSCPDQNRLMLKSEAGKYRGALACKRCKDWLNARRVTFALVPWRGDGRYSLADAIAVYASEARAEAHASRLYNADHESPYVVRTFSA